MEHVIFVCSGNYYRSRFAEHLFNFLATETDLQWNADSRGLLVGTAGNIGPISQHAVDALRERDVPISSEHRAPEPLTRVDLAKSNLVVAVKEAEHRVLMAKRFPDWADQVVYWQIDDLDCAGPEVVFPLLEEKVRSLIEELRSGPKRQTI